MKKVGHTTWKIYLPWKTTGADGQLHQATFEFSFGNTQIEEAFARADHFSRLKTIEEEKRKTNRKEKLERGGIRYCKGHKKPNVFTEGKCNLCGGTSR